MSMGSAPQSLMANPGKTTIEERKASRCAVERTPPKHAKALSLEYPREYSGQ